MSSFQAAPSARKAYNATTDRRPKPSIRCRFPNQAVPPDCSRHGDVRPTVFTLSLEQGENLCRLLIGQSE